MSLFSAQELANTAWAFVTATPWDAVLVIALTMAAESARIQKELADLQRRISCLSVAENSNQMAMKRDRLAIELRMIESGIRDRQNEICQNQSFPHADTRDEISTEYTYW